MFNVIDTQKLRDLVSHYLFYNNPQGSGQQPCSVDDAHRIKKDTAKLLINFIEEIENNQ